MQARERIEAMRGATFCENCLCYDECDDPQIGCCQRETATVKCLLAVMDRCKETINSGRWSDPAYREAETILDIINRELGE